ncbi:hypothetical protein AMATHDRAFT_72476 [Amanita thiersii Skay4041]|uniref:RING-type E3 ubiquitin transferase n=1 Tax=Amanita thiersii Skay4041 TaxID=703135 RepID=A0A2A9P1Q1_9AGAR|nr:hypothetical protein AMATHDRAFT_72476 [Amanita thiersii Skay4041]
MSPSSFPLASQAQIIRANQRDVFHLSFLKDQSESVLRTWFGTRWLARWDKEVDFVVRLIYYTFTTGRATQTLGEEYTDIWQYSTVSRRVPPSLLLRIALVLLPTIPHYLVARWGHSLNSSSFSPRLVKVVKSMPSVLSIVSDVNLAVFYIRGVYYDIVKRALGINYLSSMPDSPHTRPPSYSLLGVLIMVRLLHRLVMSLGLGNSFTPSSKESPTQEVKDQMRLDGRPVLSLVGHTDSENEPVKMAEEDERTVLDFANIPGNLRMSRSCTLCLEERTATCATECGHLFCWDCIVGWGREKAECPLCRQLLKLNRLLPIHNL